MGLGLRLVASTVRGTCPGLDSGQGYALRSAGLRLAEARRHSGHQCPLGDAQAHVAVISGPLLRHCRPDESEKAGLQDGSGDGEGEGEGWG